MAARTTPGQRLAELLRELGKRKHFYPIWENNLRYNLPGQKIKPEEAALRIATLEDLIQDLYQLYPALRPASTGNLFTTPPPPR
ncbi:hypothetical protein [Hymenobacter sp. GOD-10R]|uniref:hypothetical protein n=1 Tax=Hymenobacter sp. GOD-10R TaxID=3093922 RepID=UPI002D79A844|nr:hypothetical protein [Hymenobacter sp. GOD-10R]WRQ26697.1 hypothetical protein SD425_16615 [Hymenobacter sp. GOD-10R]